MESETPVIRKYVVRLFLAETQDDPCFYDMTYFIPPIVPRVGELIGIDQGDYTQYKVLNVCYDFPVDENNLMLIDITVEDVESKPESESDI